MMGEKFAMRGTKNKLRIVIFFSFMLVLLLWSSAPFGRISSIGSSSPSGLPADHVTGVDYSVEVGTGFHLLTPCTDLSSVFDCIQVLMIE